MKYVQIPDELWGVFDPMDGYHIFKSETDAWKTYGKWEKEAYDRSKKGQFDSFWDMTTPQRYVFKR